MSLNAVRTLVSSSNKTSSIRSLGLESSAGSAILLRRSSSFPIASSLDVGETLRRSFDDGS